MSDLMTSRPTVAGLFAGIGGIELGLHKAGFRTEFLCEIDTHATAVLRHHFGLEVAPDVRAVRQLPNVDVVTAGFPCQDLSQAGRKEGIGGSRSSLVEHVFRLCSGTNKPEWILIENVSYMLRLEKGRAMRRLVDAFEHLGYRWAYRVVDARSFGIPQRRQRVVFLAALTGDPRRVLFADDATDTSKVDDAIGPVDSSAAYGFYWTEGLRGLGWVKNAVPTIKGGSGLGIPSPPAVWLPDTGEVGTPQLLDLERLQGFEADWTKPADEVEGRRNARWLLVGNAVCVPMSEWVGRRLMEPGDMVVESYKVEALRSWPIAAAGEAGRIEVFQASMRPVSSEKLDLRGFLTQPLRPLSERATLGFLKRAYRSKLRFADGFLKSLEDHRALMASSRETEA